MASMFKGCTKLKNLNISSFRTPELTNMYAAFADCPALTSIDLSHFTAEKLGVANTLFQNDTLLQTVDISGINFTKTVGLAYSFKNCPALTTIYVNSHFDETMVGNDNDVFSGSTSLVGGSGTTYLSSHKSSEYCRIDDPANNKPGYFTVKPGT